MTILPLNFSQNFRLPLTGGLPSVSFFCSHRAPSPSHLRFLFGIHFEPRSSSAWWCFNLGCSSQSNCQDRDCQQLVRPIGENNGAADTKNPQEGNQQKQEGDADAMTTIIGP
ncbi:hypothetical protein ABKV19_020383 [Rosa sericea]